MQTASYNKSSSPARSYKRLTVFCRVFWPMRLSSFGSPTPMPCKTHQITTKPVHGTPWIGMVLRQDRVHSSEARSLPVFLAHLLDDVLSLHPLNPQRANRAASKRVHARHARHGNGRATGHRSQGLRNHEINTGKKTSCIWLAPMAPN